MERKTIEMEKIENCTSNLNLTAPKQIINQTAEYQVIEKAAHLLKKVQQHWKKSLFHNRLQFSPVSDNLNSSESENYIERLAATKFRDASYRKQSFCGVDNEMPYSTMNNGERRMDQNLLTSYDVMRNYFDLIATRKTSVNSKEQKSYPTKCARCLSKSVSGMSKHQSCHVWRPGSNKPVQSTQVSPRSNESVRTSKTYASAYSSPKVKSNLTGGQARISTSNPDLRYDRRQCSRPYRHGPRFYGSSGMEIQSEKSKHFKPNKYENRKISVSSPVNNASNVSVLNIKSSNETDSNVPEVNPRKPTLTPDKMIIIQHLPQVDIRPELSKQSGPVISIEAERNDEQIVDTKNQNIGVFNYIHGNGNRKLQQNMKEHKPSLSYSKYTTLTQSQVCSDEEFFAAQLELRSVAENFIFRLKKSEDMSGSILTATLYRLMEEVNQLINSHMNNTRTAPTDLNLPPRMEMVSELLSDELKTWGVQHPSHYNSLNNIIQHLILDIQFANNANNADVRVPNQLLSQSRNNKYSQKSSILKQSKSNDTNVERSGKGRHVSLTDYTNYYETERNGIVYRSPRTEEISLSEKLLQENALKVQRLEKAYKINHKARALKRRKDGKLFKESPIGNGDEQSEKDKFQVESPEVSNIHTTTSSSGNESHPVIAVLSPSQDETDGPVDDEDKETSDKSSSSDDKSIAEELDEDIAELDQDEESIKEDQKEDISTKSSLEQQSQLEQNQVHDPEDEDIEEIIEDSSQLAAEKQNDSLNSVEYQEDFEADVTEHQSSSTTAASLNQKENTGKVVKSREPDVSESLEDDQMTLIKSEEIKRMAHISSLLNQNTFRGIDKHLKPNKSFNNGIKVDDIVIKSKNSSIKVGDNDKFKYSAEKMASKVSEEDNNGGLGADLEGLNEFKGSQLINTSALKKLDEKENNFVKFHVRDYDGEIIFSYTGSKSKSGRQSKESKQVVSTKEVGEKQNISESGSESSGKIEEQVDAERKLVKSFTSDILKKMLDGKIQAIMEKYSGERLRSKGDSNRPSTSKAENRLIVQRSTQTSPTKSTEHLLISEINSEDLSKFDRAVGTNDDEYMLKSPDVKLNFEGSLRKTTDMGIQHSDDPHITVITTDMGIQVELNHFQTDQRMEDVVEESVFLGKLNVGENGKDDENRFSPEARQLISMMSELDSSDMEYCEESINRIDGHIKSIEVHNSNDMKSVVDQLEIRSEEMAVQMPNSSNFEKLLESKDASDRGEEDGGIEFPQKDCSTEQNRIIMKTVATECDLLSRLPFENTFATASTQTGHSKPMNVKKINSVDEVQTSNSIHSSSESIQKNLQPIRIEPSENIDANDLAVPDQSKAALEPSTKPDNKEMSILLLPDFAAVRRISSSTDLSSVIPSDINPQSDISCQINNMVVKLEENLESKLLSDLLSGGEISEPSSDESHNSPSRHEASLLIQLPSYKTHTAWSSSSETTTDEEKFLFMNQPPDDEDDVLDDLEQLMNYLKNSKSSNSYARMRHCSRHAKYKN